jgi:hypothetical protein
MGHSNGAGLVLTHGLGAVALSGLARELCESEGLRRLASVAVIAVIAAIGCRQRATWTHAPRPARLTSTPLPQPNPNPQACWWLCW